MKPNTKLIKLLNYRINQEEYSSRIYYSMSVWLDNNAYKSTSLWKKYSEEELVHAKKASDFLLAFGIMPDILPIQSVDVNYKSLVDIIKQSFEHETEVSRQCEELYKAAVEDGNPMVIELARWFVAEQIEEMEKVQTLMDMLTTFGEDKLALMLIDERIAE